MRYSRGRCERCGERIYQHIDGGYRCSNCGVEYDDDHFDDDGGVKRKVLVA